ncbi:hypothetical protein [Burkholderia sp. JKS000303]|uniref:hypothetical protein n=1 Tax=Burkholderia sp. JKS000303 TaxID=1938747 RepID=UPI000C01A5FA|nr:hypothetical protein [Burkholderia sp. JKS000303]PFH26427.1 hypothetical protein BX604_0121 [Burkholderia sp. JKS000303]
MKNEIVTPAGANGEAGRGRRLAALAVRVALAGVGVAAAHAAHAASPASCDARLTQLIVPALRHTALDRRAIHAEPAVLTGQPEGVQGVRLFVTPDHPGTPNRDATIGWVTLDTHALRALDITRDPDQPDVLKIDRHALARYVSTCVAAPAASAHPAAAMHGAVDCDALNRRAQARGDYVTGSDAGRVVTGKGRLPFFSAPDDACRIDGLFIVEHDHVDARTEYGRFTSITYLNPRTHGTADGWVPRARLQPDGTGIAPRQP